jgi:hypothetical protein
MCKEHGTNARPENVMNKNIDFEVALFACLIYCRPSPFKYNGSESCPHRNDYNWWGSNKASHL